MNLFALHLTPAAHHHVFHRLGHSDLSTQRPTEFMSLDLFIRPLLVAYFHLLHLPNDQNTK